MDNNTQKTEVTLNGQEQLLDQQLELLYKRAKGKWSWISILATIADVIVGIYAVIIFIYFYRLVGSFTDALTLTVFKAWFVLVVFGVSSILGALSKHLVVGECANLIISEKLDYRAWLRTRKKQMHPTDKYKNMALIGTHEQLFYAIQRVETKNGNADLIKRDLPGSISDVALGILVNFLTLSISISSAAILIAVIIAIFGFEYFGNTIKNSQRRNMVTWVKMIATKLENEDLKGYDKDLYLNQQ